MKCLICGKRFKRVCCHTQQAHDVSAAEYKEMFGYDKRRGIMSKEDREIMAWHTRNNGTINNLKLGAEYRFKKGQGGLGTYKRRQQTLDRLKQQLPVKTDIKYKVKG